MKFKQIIFLIVLANLYFINAKAQNNPIQRCEIGSYNGVIGYDNILCGKKGKRTKDGVLEWECVEYIVRYYKQIYNRLDVNW